MDKVDGIFLQNLIMKENLKAILNMVMANRCLKMEIFIKDNILKVLELLALLHRARLEKKFR